jgi:hypothetical protein
MQPSHQRSPEMEYSIRQQVVDEYFLREFQSLHAHLGVFKMHGQVDDGLRNVLLELLSDNKGRREADHQKDCKNTEGILLVHDALVDDLLAAWF